MEASTIHCCLGRRLRLRIYLNGSGFIVDMNAWPCLEPSRPPRVKRKLPPFHMFHLRSFTQWPDSHWDWIPLWAWKDILNAGVFPFPSYLIRMSLFPALLLYIFSLLWLCADSLFTQAWAAPGQRSEGWKQEEGRARLLIQAALLSAYLLRGNWRESCWMPAGFVLKTLAFQRHQ